MKNLQKQSNLIGWFDEMDHIGTQISIEEADSNVPGKNSTGNHFRDKSKMFGLYSRTKLHKKVHKRTEATESDCSSLDRD